MKFLRLCVFCCALLPALAGLAGQMPSNTVYLNGSHRSASAATIITARRAHMRLQANETIRLQAQMVRRHLIKPRTVLPRIDTIYYEGTPGELNTRATAGNGTLSFAYSGWSTGDESQLRAFVTRAYPVLVSIYGKPAANTTVTITAAALVDNVEGGEFTLDPHTGTVTVTVEPLPSDFTTGDNSHYGFNLLHLLLHAFHAPTLIGIDAWEEGLARAAALIASLQLDPNYDLSRDGGYLLPLYETLNQPALSNSVFFPPDGITYLSLTRLGMAMSAWLKVYTEKPTVFSDFNARYYSAIAGSPTVAGNLAGLQTLMQMSVPSVEGTAFLDWYNQQQVLRATSIVGNRVFVQQTPQHVYTSLTVCYFYTNPNGTESPLSGSAHLDYYTFDQIPVNPEEGDTISISAAGDFPGIGFLSPSFYNIGETSAQRLRIVVTIGGLVNAIYFPYQVAGHTVDAKDNITDLNEFFGVVIGADSAAVQLALPGSSLQTQLVQGAFGLNQTTNDAGLTFFARVRFDLTVNGTDVILWRNIGPWYYSPVLVVASTTGSSVTNTFAAGLSLVSFPITPTQTDAGVLFNFAPSSPNFHFAWYDPTVTGTDKYRKYPASPSITPGRGFWLNLTTAQTLTILGTLPSVDAPPAITLEPGWNLIGNTFNGDLNPWVMMVSAGPISYSLEEAIRRNVVSPVWTYNPAGYYDVKSTLAAWDGGWINNQTGNELTLQQQGANRKSRGKSLDALGLLTTGGWGVTMHARTTAAQDNLLVLGVTTTPSAGLNWRKPPAMNENIRAAFIQPQHVADGAVYATDIRDTLHPSGETWEFEVSSKQTDTVLLSWPDMSRMPAGYQLVLEDEVSGQRQYLRTTPAYQYHARGTATTPDTRRFRVLATKNGIMPVSILQCQVLHSRGLGANIQLVLSAPADLTLEIRTPTGKLIRTMSQFVDNANAPVIIPWDGHGLGGKLMPTGAYLLTVTARTAENYVIRRSAGVWLGR